MVAGNWGLIPMAINQQHPVQARRANEEVQPFGLLERSGYSSFLPIRFRPWEDSPSQRRSSHDWT
jgi:hypothetical protein